MEAIEIKPETIIKRKWHTRDAMVRFERTNPRTGKKSLDVAGAPVYLCWAWAKTRYANAKDRWVYFTGPNGKKYKTPLDRGEGESLKEGNKWHTI